MAKPEYSSLYKLARWKRERLEFIYDNPECVYCRARGELSGADVVDHIKPHKGNLTLFWDHDNWQSLCYSCHNSGKQLEENGKTLIFFDDDGFPI